MAVLFPRSVIDEFLERGVMRVGHQIAGALPSARVVSRIAPSGTHQLTLAAKVFHINRRGHDVVAFEQFAGLAEFVANFIARHEDFLGHHRGVGIRRRNHVAVDAQRLQISKKVRNLFDIGFLIDRGVGSDQETCSLSRLDAFNRFAEYAIAFDADVVRLLKSVQMHVEKEPRGRLELFQSLANEHSVGAQVNVFFAIENFFAQAIELGINHGLAAAERNDGRAAIIHGFQAFLHRQHLIDRGFIFANAAAAGAG